MNFGSRLKRIRERRGATLLWLAEQIGKTEATVQRYESGAIKDVKLDVVESLASALKVSPAYLMGWIGEEEGVITRKIPVLGQIACGEPILAEENLDGYIEEVEFGLPNGELLYLRAKGDSMSPVIPEGSLVLIKLQPDVEQNEIAAVMINNTDVTLKRVKKQNGMIILVSENPNYDPIVIPDGEEIRIIGKATDVRKSL
ncbi:LexA family protein [Jeotgalibaca sp. A127]|uniref:LexA family protein n=1 Tax=Jeotgalibaca sp. A127 TaxID=3457324 RepID=UPI003FD5A4B2